MNGFFVLNPEENSKLRRPADLNKLWFRDNTAFQSLEAFGVRNRDCGFGDIRDPGLAPKTVGSLSRWASPIPQSYCFKRQEI